MCANENEADYDQCVVERPQIWFIWVWNDISEFPYLLNWVKTGRQCSIFSVFAAFFALCSWFKMHFDEAWMDTYLDCV